MADIVIRGMEMPRFCCECPLKESVYDVGYICLPRKEPIKVNLCKGRDDACPIVPLPEGHGRLGDLDALQDEFKKFHDGKRSMLIDTAPTIVPAEGGEEDG